MITKKSLEETIAPVEFLQGNYLVFAQSTQDQVAKAMYQRMYEETTSHLRKLHLKLDQMIYSTWVSSLNPDPHPLAKCRCGLRDWRPGLRSRRGSWVCECHDSLGTRVQV